MSFYFGSVEGQVLIDAVTVHMEYWAGYLSAVPTNQESRLKWLNHPFDS
jgi:hypothetical protein